MALLLYWKAWIQPQSAATGPASARYQQVPLAAIVTIAQLRQLFTVGGGGAAVEGQCAAHQAQFCRSGRLRALQ